MVRSGRTAELISATEKADLIQKFKMSGKLLNDFAFENDVDKDLFRQWLAPPIQALSRRKRYSPTERKHILESYLSSGLTREVFAATWGVSTTSLSIWLYRYRQEGARGLLPLPRKSNDRRLGMKVAKGIQHEIIELKKKEPLFGFRKIKNWLYRFRGLKVSTGSIRKTIRNEGLLPVPLNRKRRRSSDKVRRFERAKPMELWQSDITQFTLGPASMKVYLTVFMDDHSRYIVGWKLQSNQSATLVMGALGEALVRFGKPKEILTDQGRQYFAWRGKSEFELRMEQEGIKHVVSRSHHPETLGKCERFWETIYKEFWLRVKPQDLDEARVRLKFFIDHYNHQRPHQGLAGMIPADRFFGVEKEIRASIEKTITENSLRLALQESIKPPAFLIGQIGDQKIAFHGGGGQFYLTHENINGEAHGTSPYKNQSIEKSYSSTEGIPTDTGEGAVESCDR